jgi:hypothetical protein
MEFMGMRRGSRRIKVPWQVLCGIDVETKGCAGLTPQDGGGAGSVDGACEGVLNSASLACFRDDAKNEPGSAEGGD